MRCGSYLESSGRRECSWSLVIEIHVLGDCNASLLKVGFDESPITEHTHFNRLLTRQQSQRVSKTAAVYRHRVVSCVGLMGGVKSTVHDTPVDEAHEAGRGVSTFAPEVHPETPLLGHGTDPFRQQSPELAGVPRITYVQALHLASDAHSASHTVGLVSAG